MVAHQQLGALVAVVPSALVKEVVASGVDHLRQIDHALPLDILDAEQHLERLLVIAANL